MDTPASSSAETPKKKERLKLLQKKDLGSQGKSIIFNVYEFAKKCVNPTFLNSINFNKTQKVVAQICGTSYRSVQRVCEKNKCSPPTQKKFESPRKKYKRDKLQSILNDFDNDVVRRCVLEFYDRCEYPTAERLRTVLREKINYVGSIRSVQRLLRNIGFKYKKTNDGRKFLLERKDITLARTNFLRKMNALKHDPVQRKRIYLDETWVNENHSRKYIWQTTDNKGGMKVPVGKGKRLIVCHAGSSSGFVNDCKWVFQSKSKSSDYHNEMNSLSFKEWFTDQLIPSLEEPCVIILDNAPYHSALLNKCPSTNWRKQEIIEWLMEKNIPFEANSTKVELLSKVAPYKSNKIYEIDELARAAGHDVLRLPPYHCQYNPIELIWAQIKREVADKNVSFKLADVERLTCEAINNVSAEDWLKCVEHAENLQQADWEKEIVRDEIIEPIIINLSNDTASDSEDSSDDDEYIV